MSSSKFAVCNYLRKVQAAFGLYLWVLILGIFQVNRPH